MNLEQYYISFGDHVNETATEGFFMDDKDPKTTTTDTFGTGVWEIIKYKNVQLQVPGPKWAEVFLNSHSNTTESFKRNGINDLKVFVNEITAAEQFVKANGDKFRAAVEANDTETTSSLADGLRNCLPKLRAFNQASNSGNRQYNGTVVAMDDAFKKKVMPLLIQFQRVYRDAAILCAKHYIDQHASKSTIKKIFRHTLKNYQSNNYLETELYAYCRDIHINIGDAFYS